MNGFAAVRLRKLVKCWPEQNLKNLEESKAPGQGPSPEESERLSKPIENWCLRHFQVSGMGAVKGGYTRKLTKGNDPRFNTFCPKASPLLPVIAVSHVPVAYKPGKLLSDQPVSINSANLRLVSLNLMESLNKYPWKAKDTPKKEYEINTSWIGSSFL